MIVSTLKDYDGGLNERKHDRNLHIVSVNIINIICFFCVYVKYVDSFWQ